MYREQRDEEVCTDVAGDIYRYRRVIHRGEEGLGVEVGPCDTSTFLLGPFTTGRSRRHRSSFQLVYDRVAIHLDISTTQFNTKATCMSGFQGFSDHRVTARSQCIGKDLEIFCRKGGNGPGLLLLHGYPQTSQYVFSAHPTEES